MKRLEYHETTAPEPLPKLRDPSQNPCRNRFPLSYIHVSKLRYVTV